MFSNEWTKGKNKLLDENANMELIYGDKLMVCRFSFDEKKDIAEHSHDNEQATIVIEGEMEIMYGNISRTLKAGDGCIIPGGVPHKVRITKTPFKSYDVFSPIRKEFIGYKSK